MLFNDRGIICEIHEEQEEEEEAVMPLINSMGGED